MRDFYAETLNSLEAENYKKEDCTKQSLHFMWYLQEALVQGYLSYNCLVCKQGTMIVPKNLGLSHWVLDDLVLVPHKSNLLWRLTQQNCGSV